MIYNKFANIALGASLVIFIVTAIFKYYLGELFILRLLFYVTEAALVAGIADWFAVTALFRKPLGFPWHTAIIPNNREKVINSVAGMIEHDLLSVASIKSRLEKTHLINSLIDWVEIHGSPYFINILAKFGQQILDRIDPSLVAQYIESILKYNADKVNVTPLIKRFAVWAVENGEDDKWLSVLLDEMIIIAQRPETKERIRDILEEIKEEKTKGLLRRTFKKIAEITNAVNLDDAATALHIELVEVLKDLKKPEHLLRLRLKMMFSDITVKLATEPSWSKAIEAWKKGIIERLKLSELLEILINSAIKTENHPSWESGREFLNIVVGVVGHDRVSKNAEMSAEVSIFVDWLTNQINVYWEYFKQDRNMKDQVEIYIKEMLYKLIESEHKLIGSIVKETLGALTKEDLNRFIEDKAGNDLQWIRVNGSIVGALVGLMIFLFVNLFYDPVVVPVIQAWLM